MNNPMTVRTLGPQLIALLGLPKNVISFELRCAVDEIVTVKCEYYPEDAKGVDLVLAQYKLVPRMQYPVERHQGPKVESIGARVNMSAKDMAKGVRDLRLHLAVTNAGGFDAWARNRTEAAHQAMMDEARKGGVAYAR